MRDSIDARYQINDLEKCQAKLLYAEQCLIKRIDGLVPIKAIIQIAKIRKEVDILLEELKND